MRPSKGIPDLIDAFAVVRARWTPALIIAGNARAPRSTPRTSGAADRPGHRRAVVVDARYLPIDEVGPLVRTATVVVLPYRFGTASGVLQAAYAFARPVVVTDVGSLAEAVDDGVHRPRGPSRDRQALARALVKMLSDPAEARAMGPPGRGLPPSGSAGRPIAATVLEVSPVSRRWRS